MHEPITTTVVVTHAGLAVMGGVVHALNAQRNGKSKGLLDVAVLSVIASFAGVIFALAASYFFPHEVYVSHIAAGMGGFLGVEGLSALAVRMRDVFVGKIK